MKEHPDPDQNSRKLGLWMRIALGVGGGVIGAIAGALIFDDVTATIASAAVVGLGLALGGGGPGSGGGDTGGG